MEEKALRRKRKGSNSKQTESKELEVIVPQKHILSVEEKQDSNDITQNLYKKVNQRKQIIQKSLGQGNYRKAAGTERTMDNKSDRRIINIKPSTSQNG